MPMSHGATPLQARLLDQVLTHLTDAGQIGARINEAELADRLGVSRTPVREVFRRLEHQGIVSYQRSRGFRLVRFPAASRNWDDTTEGQLLDERVMRDMALGALGSVMSERALMQRYAVQRGVLLSTLKRLTRDGLVDPSPGRGWIFADVSPSAIQECYVFRTIIEPAAILSANFQIDAKALVALDAEHAVALQQLTSLDRRSLFELDARFHALVASGAGNTHIAQAIARQNNIRRVAEYIGYIRSGRIRASMEEHRRIMAALIRGDRQLAAALMQVHLHISADETFKHIEADLELVRTGELLLHQTQTPATRD
jgi:DNA-binding GntR family transcriptional regulator